MAQESISEVAGGSSSAPPSRGTHTAIAEQLRLMAGFRIQLASVERKAGRPYRVLSRLAKSGFDAAAKVERYGMPEARVMMSTEELEVVNFDCPRS